MAQLVALDAVHELRAYDEARALGELLGGAADQDRAESGQREGEDEEVGLLLGEHGALQAGRDRLEELLAVLVGQSEHDADLRSVDYLGFPECAEDDRVRDLVADGIIGVADWG